MSEAAHGPGRADSGERQPRGSTRAGTSGMQTAVDGPSQPKTSTRGGTVLLIVVVMIALGAVAFIVAQSGTGGAPDVQPHVMNVHAVDPGTVEVTIDWENTGSGAGSASCTLQISVYDRSGALQKTELDSVSTNGSVAAHGHQVLSDQWAVVSGDASYVTTGDVQTLC